MSEINDELLNKYIDNELESGELAGLKSAMDNDTDALARLKALRAIDSTLRQMQNEPAPDGFTDKLMNKISAAAKIVQPKISYFFITIVSIFSLAILALLIFAFQGMKIDDTKSNLDPFFQQIKEFAGKNFGFLDIIFKNNAVMLIGALLALILLFTAYFTVESHKNFKHKLDSISR